MKGFSFWVEDDKIRVQFVAPRVLARIGNEGHATGGDYSDNVIRLVRGEYRTGLRAMLLHELGHYLVERQGLKRELRARTVTEEDVCDVLTWLPRILGDERNAALLAFLGLRRVGPGFPAGI